MTQPVQEADVAPDLKSSEANALDYEHNPFRALHRRLEAAAEALKRASPSRMGAGHDFRPSTSA